MKTICLYFEIHQIIHLNAIVVSISVRIITIMMIMKMNAVSRRLQSVLIFRH